MSMNKLKNYLLLGEDHFGSGSVNSDAFNTWVRVFKKQLRMELNKIDATDFEIHKGHFYVSGFFRVGEQLVYFSISDVRSGFDADQMLVRTAEDNKDLEEDFAPHTAIIVYSQKGEYNEHYLESRRIKPGASGYEMLEGVPLTKKLLSEMLAEIDPVAIERIYSEGFLPKNLLYFDSNTVSPTLIWYVKPSARKLSFVKRLGIKDGIMNLPALVFKLEANDFSIFATKSNHPDENTTLYHAPFYNIYDSGSICMGNAKAKFDNDVCSIMKGWEDAFFQSKFTELHGAESPILGNIGTFTKRQIKNNKPFDKDVLKVFGGQSKFPIKIKDLIKL